MSTLRGLRRRRSAQILGGGTRAPDGVATRPTALRRREVQFVPPAGPPNHGTSPSAVAQSSSVRRIDMSADLTSANQAIQRIRHRP